MKTYRAATIGHTGRGNFGHGLDVVFNAVEETELVAVADANPDGLLAAGKRLGLGDSAQFADYREMLDKTQPEIVSVAARWVKEHRDMVVAVAESGVKGIFCEKPLSQTLQEADEMLDACAKHNVKIAIAHQNRVHPHLIEAKRLFDGGLIGDLREINAHGKCDARGGGQDLIVLGTHMFDLMRMFGGNPRWVEACVLVDGRDATPADVKQGDEEVGLIVGNHLRATYGLESGALGTFDSRKEGNHFGDRAYGIEFVGTNGILAYRNGYLMHYPHGAWTPHPVAETWELLADSRGLGGLNEMIVRDLIAAVEEVREPAASGEDGRWALEMILGVYAAHINGRTPLPMVNRSHPLANW
ncbi:MAG: Gfo/Idh/MocA family oxidoreductase [Candidatus Poribacteria bacterium]|nr:Gfo/Idh/MocA family oxidoreductase [Candidatus Poribacteria bacterium]